MTVETLGEAEQGSVWRCPAFTVAWVDGKWSRLNRDVWIPLDHMPTGPFTRIDNPVFDDYRDSIRGGRASFLLGWPGPNE